MASSNCPFCHKSLLEQGGVGDTAQYHCSICGKFLLTLSAKAVITNKIHDKPELAPLFSHIVRKLQHTDDWPTFDTTDIGRIEQESSLPNAEEQLENAVLWFAREQKHPGNNIEIHFDQFTAIFGAHNVLGARFIVEAMIEKNLLTRNGHTAKLTFLGWELFNNLTRRTSSGHKGFMAMDFKNEDLSNIFNSNFKGAAHEAGFDLVRLDEHPQAGSIDERLRVEIRRSAFIISDLTDANPGAYWEAGFAEGLGKPVIYTCETNVFEEIGTHFDTNHHYTIKWDKNNPIAAADELKTVIRSTLPDKAVMSDPAFAD